MLGVRHQPEHVARGVADPRDVVLRAVGVLAGGVTEHDLALVQRPRGIEAAGGVLDRDREPISPRARAREGGVGIHDLDLDLPADEPQRGVREQGAGQQSGLAQHLEAVADPQYRAAVTGEGQHRGHHRREAGDRAHAQVVPVGEPAGDDHGVDAVQVRIRVPEELGLAHAVGREQGVALVAGTGKADHAEAHQRIS